MNITHPEESFILSVEIDEVKEYCGRVIAEICEVENALVFIKDESSIENMHRRHYSDESQIMCVWISSYKPCCHHQEAKAVHKEVFVKLSSERSICQKSFNFSLLFDNFISQGLLAICHEL